MAYISQEEKKELMPGIKKVLKTYGMKGTVSIRHYSTLIVTLSEGELDLIKVENEIRKERHARNNYGELYLVDNTFQQSYHHLGKFVELGEHLVHNFYQNMFKAMKGSKWFDKSDIMTDYHHIAYYCYIDVGRSRLKPYRCTKNLVTV
tara:strand:+ start:2452 stop:2895 length:444 start_codon:yes stop_codon:yes gene_type:complete